MTGKSGDVRPSLMAKAIGTDHECSQGSTLATICEKLEGIVRDIKEIKENQKTYINEQKEQRETLNQADIDRAKYPSPEVVNGYIKRVDAHDIYFGIMAVAICALITLMIGLATGALQKIFGI